MSSRFRTVVRTEIDFDKVGSATVYSVTDELTKQIGIRANLGKGSSLQFLNIVPSSFSLRTASGTTLQEGTDYTLNIDNGSIVVLDGGSVATGDSLMATFQYQPVADSELLNLEEANPIFDGLHLSVMDRPLALDLEETGWVDRWRWSGIRGWHRYIRSGPNSATV